MVHPLPLVPVTFLEALPQEVGPAPGWGMGCPHPLQPREGQCQATELCLSGYTTAVQAQLDFSSFNQKQAFKLGKEKSTEQKKYTSNFLAKGKKKNKLHNILTGNIYLLIFLSNSVCCGSQR